MSAFDLVTAELASILRDKGVQDFNISPETQLLNGPLDIDSLDLATLVVVLEEKTSLTPFKNGFVMFRTAGELAALFGG